MKGQTNAWLKDIVSGEKISIILTTNQSSHTDLMGAVITVSYAGNLTEYTWEGSAIQTVIPPMTDYTVSYSDVNGYSTPKQFNGKAIDGRVIEVIGTYNTEIVTVNVSADEGEVSGYEVTLAKVNKYGSNNEYTKVEYIESNGNQYINTGVIPSSDKIRVVVDFLYTATPSSKAVFGCQHNSETSRYGLICYNSPASIYVGSSAALLPKTISLNTRYMLDAEADNGALNVSWNGSKTSTSYSGTIYKGYSFYLFGNNRENSVNQMSSIKMYSCQIYDNDILVRDYIPVIDSNGVAGLWDKVNNIFYSSSSSTAFIAGNIDGDVIATQTTSSASYKIPYGVNIKIDASNVGSFITPESITFITSQTSRYVELIYNAITFGVYVQDVNGRLYSRENWDKSKMINGIAVITDKASFVMSPKNLGGFVWSNGSYIDVPSTQVSSSSSALSYMDGYKYTGIILSTGGSVMNAAYQCSNYSFPNGQKGYLGSIGEWRIAIDNADEILAIYSMLGVTLNVNGALEKQFWTSNQIDSGNAYYADLTSLKWIQTQNKQQYNFSTIPFTFLNNPFKTGVTWVDLLGVWDKSDNYSSKDGYVYTCKSPGDGNFTLLRCVFNGVTSITFRCMSNGEALCDFLTVGELDSGCSRTIYNISFEEEPQGTSKDITYKCDGGIHYVDFCYSKDGSISNSPDNASVFVSQIVYK